MARKIKISAAQLRAARGLLNWSARELSERSGVSQSAILRAERGKDRTRMHEHGLLAIKAALEKHGVEFLEHSGVRLFAHNGYSGEAPSLTRPNANAGCKVTPC